MADTHAWFPTSRLTAPPQPGETVLAAFGVWDGVP
ncbi:hypothetical protein MT49_2753 [Mycobacterium tuberculosis 49-02]|nr:hypothetical protein MT49_2753 [Mycobacterium tuberculosis 49-02]